MMQGGCAMWLCSMITYIYTWYTYNPYNPYEYYSIQAMHT
jgi:hypothetical protein